MRVLIKTLLARNIRILAIAFRCATRSRDWRLTEILQHLGLERAETNLIALLL